MLLENQGRDRPITSSLANLGGQFFTNDNLIAAGSMLVAIPTLVVYLILQTPVRQRPRRSERARADVEDRAGRFVDIESDGTSFVDRQLAVAGGVVVALGCAARRARRRRARTTAVVGTSRSPTGALDVVAPVGIVAEHGSGYPGHPGLARPAA